MSGKVITLCVLIANLVAISCQEYQVVRTISGKIRGIVENYGDQKVYQFRSIPYAKPPLGELRFRRPQPYGSWDYILDATKDGSPCMQFVGDFGIKLTTNKRVTEDCLFLNVHVPRDVSAARNRAVMVWIHGGAFTMGQGSWYDGSHLALNGDVIVVTVNYRLGIFGFLSTFDQASPGNYGLWDQRMAIEWVKSNIAAFGGNPSAITIFGESAGGFSVSFQSIIPYNRGLFQRVIAQSGVSVSLPLVSDSSKLLEYLAENLQCDDSTLPNTYALVECLRQKSSEQLLNVSQTYMMSAFMNYSMKWVLGPSLDGDLFKANPEISLSDKSSSEYNFFKSLDYMAGTTDGEGSIMLLLLSMWSQQLEFNLTEGVPTRVLCDQLSRAMAEAYLRNATGTAKALCDKYKIDGGENDKMVEQGIEAANLNSDLFFIGPTVKSLLAHDEKDNERKTFHYLFTRAFSSAIGISFPEWFKQSGHGTELLYLFGAEKGAEMFNLTLTYDDYSLEQKMLKYWTNFAKTGDPNDESLPTWKEYGKERNYIQLDHKIVSGKDVFSDRMAFILEEIPKIIEKAESGKHEEL